MPDGAPQTLLIPLEGALGTLLSWLVTDNPSGKSPLKTTRSLNLRGHYSRDWSESVNVIGVIGEPFAGEFI